jgi:Protein of unknown function (DUF1018)
MVHELPVSKSQIAAIHVLKGKARLDDETYRALLEANGGVRSSKLLTMAAAARVIDRLKQSAGQGGAVAGLDSPIGGKLRALWIAGYNLGIVRDRTDRAMLSFLERQTRVSHPRFFTDPAQGTAAVEALKGWLARDAGVVWLKDDKGNPLAGRRSVAIAQWQRLVALKVVEENGFFDFAHRVTRTTYMASQRDAEPFTAQHYDTISAALGRKLRAALAQQQQGKNGEDAA